MSTSITTRAQQFLQQKQDYDWFIALCRGENRQDRHEKGAVPKVSSGVLPQPNFGETGYDVHDKRAVSKANPGVLTKSNFEESGQDRHDKQAISKANPNVFIRGNSEELGQDRCEERLVVTTFPIDLTKVDFEEYIDRKFSNLDHNHREQMKELYKVNADADMQTNVSFDNENNGIISATLAQILLERNKNCNELKISVGYIKFTRKPAHDWQHLQNYWIHNRDRVVRALQYKYGVELKRELC